MVNIMYPNQKKSEALFLSQFPVRQLEKEGPKLLNCSKNAVAHLDFGRPSIF